MYLGLLDPSLEDGKNKTGATVDKTNEISLARGIPLRAFYYGRPNESSENFGYTWMGKAQIDKKTKIVKRDVKTTGILVKGEKVVNWSIAKIKGIN